MIFFIRKRSIFSKKIIGLKKKKLKKKLKIVENKIEEKESIIKNWQKLIY